MMEQKLQQGIMREPNSNGGDAGEDGSLQVGLLSAEVSAKAELLVVSENKSSSSPTAQSTYTYFLCLNHYPQKIACQVPEFLVRLWWSIRARCMF